MKPKSFTRGEKVIYENKVYDFGYIGQEGHAIIYVEGETNLQDAFTVALNKLKRSKYQSAKPKPKGNSLFHIEMDDQPSSSYERYYVQASSKKDALNKLCKKS